MKITDWARQRWFLASLAAFSFSLSHLFVDFQIGLFGESSISMSFLQAALIATIGVLFGWWAFAVGEARHGSRSGIVVAFTFAFGWAFVLNGLVAVLAAPPPSDGFPYQDITHIGSMIFGGLAAFGLWEKIREVGGVEWRAGAWASVPIVVVAALEGVLALAG